MIREPPWQVFFSFPSFSSGVIPSVIPFLRFFSFLLWKTNPVGSFSSTWICFFPLWSLVFYIGDRPFPRKPLSGMLPTTESAPIDHAITLSELQARPPMERHHLMMRWNSLENRTANVAGGLGVRRVSFKSGRQRIQRISLRTCGIEFNGSVRTFPQGESSGHANAADNYGRAGESRSREDGNARK